MCQSGMFCGSVVIDVCPECFCLISQNGHNYASVAVVGHVMKHCEIGLG